MQPSNKLTLTPTDNRRLADLCGQCDENLRQVEQQLGVQINNRGSVFQITGPEPYIETARNILVQLYSETGGKIPLSPSKIHLILQAAKTDLKSPKTVDTSEKMEDIAIQAKSGLIKGRNQNQQLYLHKIMSYAINFGIGPAGTGKTYLAVACAVNAFEKNLVSRIILVRPAVEAGERLGFLPGDLAQKVDPYLRPLYDALYEMLGAERVTKLVERNSIEIAPLAYMRGRTLTDSFIILDEAQNTTKEQMKMFLTRIGFGSTAVITGDITQIDLPRDSISGLRHAMEVLKDVDGLSFTYFNSHDVVRHPLVQNIVRAYDEFEANKKGNK